MVNLEQSEQYLVEELFKNSDCKDKKIVATDRLTGDASTRRYYRIFTEAESYVACLADASKEDPDFVILQKVLVENKVRVPYLFDGLPERGFLLQEDLGDQTLLKRLARVTTTMEVEQLYTQAIDLLLSIHQIDPSKYSDLEFTKREFDIDKLMFEIRFSMKHFVTSFLETQTSDKDRKVVEREFLNLCREITSKKKVITHRDYHSRNLMVLPNEELVVIDFQDARMGCPQYDLASLIEDSYYSIGSKNREKLVKYYFDSLSTKFDCEQPYEDFIRIYKLMSIQRTFKAIGTFSYIYQLRKDKRYIKYIGYGFERIKRLLFDFDEYSSIRLFLSRVYYEN